MTITATGLGKSYGRVRAVDDVSFTVHPGRVTGFLGPNGSGKSTTMRLMLGLDRGQGTTTYDGIPLTSAPSTTRAVGVHLDAKVFHPNRTARNHLRMLAAEANLPDRRVDEVIDLVGLTAVARSKPKSFSLGMGQRLGLAGAILADPKALLLDEPANGLDPQSIHWLREFLRFYASQGREVLVSSHLLSEIQLMADDVIVIAKGKLIASGTMGDFVSRSTKSSVLIRCTDRDALGAVLKTRGMPSEPEGVDGLSVIADSTDVVGDAAHHAGVLVRELTMRRASLEEAFLELTADDEQFAFGRPTTGGAS